MKKIVFTKKQERKITNLYSEKLINISEIGKTFKVSHNTIFNFLKSRGINPGRSERKKLLCSKGKIKSWNTGLTKENDLRVLLCSQKLKASKKVPVIKRNDISPKEVICLFKKNVGTLEIAKKYNCSISPIRRILHENGISLSKKGKPAQKERIMKMVETRKRRGSYESKRIGKSFEQIYGKEKTKKIKEKLKKTKKRLFKEGKMQVWNKGFCSEEDVRIKKGENHPNWRGGKSFEPYDKTFNNKFKRAIRKRDNQVCMVCGIHREKVNRALDVHHINYDKLLSIPQNCISLCRKCHTTTNTNRKYWKTFFQEILNKNYDYKYSENEEIKLNLGANDGKI